jgi:two-component system CheB/CheR fusion protein
VAKARNDGSGKQPKDSGDKTQPVEGQPPLALAELMRRALVEHFAPAAVLINSKNEGLFFSGPVDAYLKIPSGKASKDLLAMLREGLKAKVRAAIAEAGRTGKAAETHGAVVGGGGRRVKITVHPVADDQAQLMLVSFSGDVQARTPEAAEAAPEPKRQADAARTFFENIVDTVREPLIVLDRNLKIVAVNRAYAAVFGQPEDAGEPFIFEADHRRWDNPRLRELLEKVIPSNSAVDDYEVEADLRGLGRRRMLLNARRVRLGEEASEHLLLAITDVTEREKRREELEERTARLSAILETVPDAVINIDEHGIIGSFSVGAERIFGYTEKEVVGKNVSILMAEPDHSRHDGYLRSYIDTGRSKIIGIGREVNGRRKDGSHMPLMLNVTESMFDKVRVFTGVLRDLTAQKHTEEELRQARKMEVMGQLVGGVAHDFNNLLTVIAGNLEMLADRVADPDADLVSDAREAAKLASDLTGQMLAFARRRSLAPTKIDVNALVLDTTDMLRRMIDESVHVSTILGRDTPAIFADEPSLRAALLNLAVNARDAMPSGGDLTIETSSLPRDSDPPGGAPQRFVRIAVIDTGVGMTAEVKERALEPFFTTKEVGKGSGLGLSMVYGFTKQSGGDLEIESQPGAGTTVTILLPAVAAGVAESVTGQAAAPARQRGAGRILLVEDDPRVRRVTVRRLQQLGYAVTEADCGPAALALLDAGEMYDLLFTDVVMPKGMSGGDLAREARKRRPGLPVLFSSGYAAGDVGLGPDDVVLQKPYGVDDLGQAIRNALDG